MHAVERAIHGLTTGMLQIPPGVDPGDFILSGGSLKQGLRRVKKCPSLSEWIADDMGSQAHKAASTAYTEAVHLRNLAKKLGAKVALPVDRLVHRDLESYIQVRVSERKASTVDKERTTIIGLFRWAVAHGHLDTSPANDLSPIQGEVDLPAFRTPAELERTIGGKRSQPLQWQGLDSSLKMDEWLRSRHVSYLIYFGCLATDPTYTTEHARAIPIVARPRFFPGSPMILRHDPWCTPG
jgi:hypothetical protein